MHHWLLSWTVGDKISKLNHVEQFPSTVDTFCFNCSPYPASYVGFCWICLPVWWASRWSNHQRTVALHGETWDLCMYGMQFLQILNLIANELDGWSIFSCSWPHVMGIYYCWKMQVSDLINCGVYVFTPDIFTAIQDVSTHREDRGWSL